MKTKENNYAFIDGQNLYFGTTKCKFCAESKNIDFKRIKVDDCDCGNAWKIDLFRFRKYLKDSFNIVEAYYFLGLLNEANQNLYSDLQHAGFIVVFREHNSTMHGNKKGNVDTDIVFEMMKHLIENMNTKIILVSGDGDYYKTVNYLIQKNVFLKILFPNGKGASSLYNKISSKYKLSLNRVRDKIAYRR